MKNVGSMGNGGGRRRRIVGVIVGVVAAGVLVAGGMVIRFNHAVHAAAPGDVEPASPRPLSRRLPPRPTSTFLCWGRMGAQRRTRGAQTASSWLDSTP